MDDMRGRKLIGLFAVPRDASQEQLEALAELIASRAEAVMHERDIGERSAD